MRLSFCYVVVWFCHGVTDSREFHCVSCTSMTELEAKLEENQAVQEELKNKVEQTAAAVEEVKTTMTEGKSV